MRRLRPISLVVYPYSKPLVRETGVNGYQQEWIRLHFHLSSPCLAQMMNFLVKNEDFRLGRSNKGKWGGLKDLATWLVFTLDFSSSSKMTFFGLGGGSGKGASSGNLGSHLTIPAREGKRLYQLTVSSPFSPRIEMGWGGGSSIISIWTAKNVSSMLATSFLKTCYGNFWWHQSCSLLLAFFCTKEGRIILFTVQILLFCPEFLTSPSPNPQLTFSHGLEQHSPNWRALRTEEPFPNASRVYCFAREPAISIPDLPHSLCHSAASA